MVWGPGVLDSLDILMKGMVKRRATPIQSTNPNYQCTVEIGGLLQINTVDGRNPAPPGMYKTL